MGCNICNHNHRTCKCKPKKVDLLNTYYSGEKKGPLNIPFGANGNRIVEIINEFIKENNIPDHEWVNTSLRFQLPDGSWGQAVNLKGSKGDQGDKGDPFTIYKSYPTIVAMELDFENVPEGSFVAISSDEQDPDNAKLFLRGQTEFTFITDMSGIQGIKGDQGEQGIQGPQGPQGPQGEKGELTVIHFEVNEDMELVQHTTENSELDFELQEGDLILNF